MQHWCWYQQDTLNFYRVKLSSLKCELKHEMEVSIELLFLYSFMKEYFGSQNDAFQVLMAQICNFTCTQGACLFIVMSLSLIFSCALLLDPLVNHQYITNWGFNVAVLITLYLYVGTYELTSVFELTVFIFLHTSEWWRNWPQGV